MISFNTSTGKSSSFSGPVAAFSFPFGGALLTASSTGSAPVLRAGTCPLPLVGGTASTPVCVAMRCASSSEGECGRIASSDGSGDAVLGEPGESGEEAMLLVEVARARQRHLPSPG
jgi:hypothetical protein